jgi:hypothetical protein
MSLILVNIEPQQANHITLSDGERTSGRELATVLIAIDRCNVQLVSVAHARGGAVVCVSDSRADWYELLVAAVRPLRT